MNTRPPDTSAEEPNGGNLHVRLRRGPGRGNRPGLLNNTRLFAAALALALTIADKPAPVQADALPEGRIKHVLLISIDGLHALDVANFVESHPASALDQLSDHGVTFSNARTPANSDSFPGILGLVPGGSPRTHGIFYDYSYDRTIWAPGNTTCAGPAGT